MVEGFEADIVALSLEADVTRIENAGLIGDNNGSGNIGCKASNPTCNPTQLRAQNAINTIQPQLRDASHGDFHLKAGAGGCALGSVTAPNFTWAGAPTRPSVPAGDLSNIVPADREGLLRAAGGPPGAYICVGAKKRLYLPAILRRRG